MAKVIDNDEMMALQSFASTINSPWMPLQEKLWEQFDQEWEEWLQTADATWQIMKDPNLGYCPTCRLITGTEILEKLKEHYGS
jgi:hypothetical protein